MSEKRTDFEAVHKPTEIGEEKFKPTCRICGRQHWPLDPSCIGKKGLKAEARARAKAEKLARAEAKARAKAEKKAGARGKGSAEVESVLREELEARLKAEKEKIEMQREETREAFEEERRARERMEAELKAQTEARLRAEEQAAEYARQKEEVRQQAALAEQEKSKAEERLRVATESRNGAEARAEMKLRAEAEKIEIQREKTREALEEERRARERMEAELKAEREARVRAEEQAAEYARQREEVRQWAAFVEQEKLKAEEKLRTASERLRVAEARAEAKLRAEAEAMARVDMKERGMDVDERGEATKRVREGGANDVSGLLGLCAGDIMERDVTWCGPQESVGAVLAKMRNAGSEYVVIGSSGEAEGIVGRSELKGRLSVGVRRAMGKWKRGGSDTTLGMAVKFVMIRGVQVVSEDTPVTSLMKQMRQSGRRVLAVAGEDGKVAGLVTACNVMKVRALLRLGGNPNLLEAKETAGGDVPSAVKTEIRGLGVFKPSGVFRWAGKNSKSEVSTL